jgi:hypothetical protein
LKLPPHRPDTPQECVYHKALMDGKTPSTVARLAKQAAGMYGDVIAVFNSPVRLDCDGL